MLMAILVFASGFLLSATAAYYSIIGLIAIFPGEAVAIATLGISLEIAKLVIASWLYRNWKLAPKIMKYTFSVLLSVLMLLTSMGVFGFLSKAHLEHTATIGAVEQSKLATLDATIESREKTILLIERQINNIDNSLNRYIEIGSVTKGLQQKKSLQRERTTLEKDRKTTEQELIDLKTEKNKLMIVVKKQEAEVGPLKYIAELIYGKDAANHFDSAVRIVIILLIIVFDPLAVMLLIAGNFTLGNNNKQLVEIKPKRKYTKRKPKNVDANSYSVINTTEDFGITQVKVPSALK